MEGWTGHISKIPLLLAHVITEKKHIYLTTIDCRDEFCSVTHDILS
jgi:hypothetical protein